jgi:chromosome segregation ATPase
VTAHAITLDPLGWIRSLGSGPPTPDAIDQLRQEMRAAFQVERQERQALSDALSAAKQDLATTRQELVGTKEELGRSREFGKHQANTIVLLESTVKALQANAGHLTTELSGLLGSNGALQEAMRRLEADHKTDQETIALLRERLHTMEKELTTLRDERQQHIGTIAGLRMAIDDLKRQLDTANAQIRRGDEGGAG